MSSLSIQLPSFSGLVAKSKLAAQLVSHSNDKALSEFKDLHSVLKAHGVDPKTVNTEREAIVALLSIIQSKPAPEIVEAETALNMQVVEAERAEFKNYLKTASILEVQSRYGNQSNWESLSPEQAYAYGIELVDWSNRNELAPSKFWYAKGTL